jgi:magnesium transporter
VLFVVVYGFAPDDDGLVEVHCYLSERFLLTVRSDQAPGLEDLRRHLARRPAGGGTPAWLLHSVVDALVDSFLPVLNRYDERLELIEQAMFASPSKEQLQDVFRMKRRLLILRRVIGPQRDVFARLTGSLGDVPGMTRETERYYRDVYDHLVRLTERLDAQRDLMTGAIDLYLSSSSNRLNETMKQLTVIATIFLPLTFVTGFFGQNFRWLVEHVGGWPAFVGLGLGLDLVVAAALFVYFRRKGWWSE